MKQPYTPQLIEALAQDFALHYIYKKQESSWLAKLEKRVVCRAETIFKHEYSEDALERKQRKMAKKTATKKAPATKKMPVKKKK